MSEFSKIDQEPTFQRAASKSWSQVDRGFGILVWSFQLARASAARLNAGFRINKKYQSFQAFPVQLPNFGLPKSIATHRAAMFAKCPCTQLHALHLRWGRRFMETPQRLGASLLVTLVSATGIVLAAGLYRVSTAPPGIALVGVDEPSGQTRCKDSNEGSELLVCVRF